MAGFAASASLCDEMAGTCESENKRDAYSSAKHIGDVCESQ